jgi:hypothetical protein
MGLVPRAGCCQYAQSMWSFPAIRQFWTFGYRSTDVSYFFDALPSDISRLLHAVLKLGQDAKTMPRIKLSDSKAASPEVANNMRSECNMWQSQSWCGFLQLFYDPDTGERTGVAFNEVQARLFGMQCDELLARFIAHDLPLPFAPQDLLLLLTDAVANEHSDGERYFRTIQPSRLPALVCVSTKRSYNHAAQLIAVRSGPDPRALSLAPSLHATTPCPLSSTLRLFTLAVSLPPHHSPLPSIPPPNILVSTIMILPLPQVRHLTRVVTCDEYDAATRRSPAACPLFAAGDTRCGRFLLRDAAADAAAPTAGLSPLGRRRRAPAGRPCRHARQGARGLGHGGWRRRPGRH